MPQTLTAVSEVRIFVSYSHKDEAARAKLETHLAQLKRDGVSTWFDGDLNAGEALDTNIARQLRGAHVFVALLSPEYLASTYCWEVEYKRAMGRRARGTIRVVAVLLRPCDWRNTRAVGFKLLPKDGRPVSEAVSEGLRGRGRFDSKGLLTPTSEPDHVDLDHSRAS